MPSSSSVPPKKRKYVEDDSPFSSKQPKDVIDMLSLQSSPSSSTHSDSSSGTGESTLGSSFSPNMATLVDTQALTAASPDFQTQNSFVVDLNTASNQQNLTDIKETPAFTLTRMPATTAVKNNTKKQTPRRQSPRNRKISISPVQENTVDESLEDRIPSERQPPPSNRKGKSLSSPVVVDTPMATQQGKEHDNKKQTSQGSHSTSKATNTSNAKAAGVKERAPLSTDEHYADVKDDKALVNRTKKKRPLPDNETSKASTTKATTPPKSKGAKKVDTKTSALVQPEVESVPQGKENVPAISTKTTTSTAPPSEDAKPQKKKKKLTFQDQIFQHMMFSYKPFSLKTLAQELKTTEAALNFLMLSLIDKNLVVKKEFSNSNNTKTKELYWVNYGTKAKELQSHLATASEIQTTQQEYDALVHELSQTQSMLAALKGDGPSNQDLTRQLEEAEIQFQKLQSELHELKGRIQDMRGSAEENNPKRLKQSINYMRDIWKKRREQCNDFIEQLADGMEKKPKEVIKLLELEMDGDIQMPPKYKLE
jgi:predicted transcriptional regulator